MYRNVKAHQIASANGVYKANRDGGFDIRCPAHDSSSRKLYVKDKDSGTGLILNCRSASCDYWAIWDALGLERPQKQDPHICTILCASYDSTDGTPRKRHRQDYSKPCHNRDCEETGAHKHVWGERGHSPRGTHFMDWPPTGQQAADPYVVGEGEKAALHIAETGATGMSWFGGTGSVHLVCYDKMVGRKPILWPDNDDPGRKAMDKLAQLALDAGAPEVKIIPTSGHDGSDAADLSVQARRAKIATAIPWTPPTNPPSTGLHAFPWALPHEPPWLCTYDAAISYTLRLHAAKLLAVRSSEGVTSLLVDNGFGVWQNDAGVIEHLIGETLSTWLSKAFAEKQAGLLDDKAFIELVKWERRMQASSMRKRAIESASRVVTGWVKAGGMPRDLTTCERDDLDPPTHYLGSPRGVIDLDTGQVITGQRARAALVTRSIRDRFDPAATHPTASALFDHLAQDDFKWLLDAIGFALRGRPSRRMYLLEGPTGGGKSTMMGALIDALGDYGASIRPTLLHKGIPEGTGPTPELASFVNARICFASETSNRFLDTSFVKAMSGGDNVSYRNLHSNEIIDRPATATIFIACNEANRPKMRLASDDALYERIRELFYPPLPAANYVEDLGSKLAEPAVRQALIAMLVRAATHNTKPPEDAPSVRKARETIREESMDEAELWLRASVVPTPGMRLTTQQLWDAALIAAEERADSKTVWGLTRLRLQRLAKALKILPAPKMIAIIGTRTQAKGWLDFAFTDVDMSICHKCGRHVAVKDTQADGSCRNVVGCGVFK